MQHWWQRHPKTSLDSISPNPGIICKPLHPGLGEWWDGWAPTFWMSVMSTSLITLFLLEDPDLELSKHR